MGKDTVIRGMKRNRLLELLIEDAGQYKLAVPKEDREQKNLIRSLMNVRMPGEVSVELSDLQDAYLQEELAAKGVVALTDIPTIKEQYGSSVPFADRISLCQFTDAGVFCTVPQMY